MNDDHLVISLKRPRQRHQHPEEPMPAPRALAPVHARRRARSPRTGLLITVGLVIGFAAGYGVSYFFAQNSAPVGGQPASAETAAVRQPTAIDSSGAAVASVGRLISLPQGETPTVATVSDLSKLQGEPFFANAKVGDIVLIYTQAREAYLYDPVQDKLVEVAPVTTSATQ